MRRVFAVVFTGVVGLSACSDSAEPPLAPAVVPEQSFLFGGVVRVTNGNDAGPGSFRQAILDANADRGVKLINFTKAVTISLVQPVVYTGGQDLTIEGNRSTINGAGLPAGSSGFLANGGGDLALANLTVRRAPGTGITVAVPALATGTQKVTLVNVTVANNGSHGVLVNDQAEYFTDPNSTSPEGSAASVEVNVIASQFENNGFTDLDQDGLRVNEGGPGTLRALVTGVRVEGNGGDGIEFDERGVGDIQFTVLGTALIRNGSFSSEDFDDGIDLDESGDGSIVGSFTLSSANDNFEQGFDLNENDAGDLRVDMTLVEAINNREEGIEYEEDDDFAGGGNIVATLTGIKTRGNGSADGDAGLKLREKGPGDLDARLSAIESSNNFVTGIQLREDAEGNLTGRIQNATARGNEGDGIEFDENGAGNLVGVVERSNSSNNTAAGVLADQAGAGTGTLKLVAVTLNGNGGGAVVANAGVVVTRTP